MTISRWLASAVMVVMGAAGCKGGAKDKTTHTSGVEPQVAPNPATGDRDSGCKVTSTFAGRPGSLWVVDAKGVFTVYDTSTGALVKTVTGPGWSSGVYGAGGLLWLTNLNNNRDLVAMDLAGKPLPALGFDASVDPVVVGGTVWTVGSDDRGRTTVYAITSPTAVTRLTIDYVIHNLAASSEGAFMLGAPSPQLGNTEVIHVDPANTKIDWKVEVAKPGHDIQNASLVALPGKVFVLSQSGPETQDLFAIDTVTHTVGAAVKVEQFSQHLMTDGVGLYVFGHDDLYELDQTTFAPKRTLPFRGGDGDVVNPGTLIAAGALWMGRRCGGTTYVRRIDLATWTVADMPYPLGHGDAVGRMAYVPPP